MAAGMVVQRLQRAVLGASIALSAILLAASAPGCDPASDAFDLTVHLVFPADQDPLDGVDLLELDIAYADGNEYAFFLQPVAPGSWQLDRIPGVIEGETATLTLRGMVGDPADPGNVLEVANGTSGPVALGTVDEIHVYFSARGRFGVVDGPLSMDRAQPQLVALPGGDALVVGGRAGDVPSPGIERFTRAADGTYTFEVVDDAYHRLGATLLRVDTDQSSHDGQILVAGGWEGAVAGTSIVAKVDRLDPETGAISTVFDLPNALAGAVATQVGDGRWVLSGGTVSWGSDTEPSSRYLTVDAVNSEAVQSGTMELPRYDHAAAVLPDGRVMVCGGYRSSSVWDETTDHCETWLDGAVADAASMNAPRAGFALVAVPGDEGGRVLAVGGVDNPDDEDPTVLDTAEIYDPELGEWTLLSGRMAEPRQRFETLAVADQRIVVCGGSGVDDEPLPSCEAFDLATEAFSPLPDLVIPGGRSSYGAAVLESGLVLLVGGEGAEADTAYLYNP